MENEKWINRTVSLADRFGDNGLISVMLAEIDDGALVVDTWLMSCRVLKRGVEFYMLNHLVELARKHRLNAIRGEYIPTPKNALVKELYAKLGFDEIRVEKDGHSWWELPLSDDWKPKKTFIEEKSVDR
jgi:FkbH-like protein